MAQHARLKIEAGVRSLFLRSSQPAWQRGTNENTNGLLRQYFPKGTDLSMHSANEIAAVAAAPQLAAPGKTLDWKTPAEALDSVSPISRQRSCCDDRLNPPCEAISNERRLNASRGMDFGFMRFGRLDCSAAQRPPVNLL